MAKKIILGIIIAIAVPFIGFELWYVSQKANVAQIKEDQKTVLASIRKDSKSAYATFAETKNDKADTNIYRFIPKAQNGAKINLTTAEDKAIDEAITSVKAKNAKKTDVYVTYTTKTIQGSVYTFTPKILVYGVTGKNYRKLLTRTGSATMFEMKNGTIVTFKDLVQNNLILNAVNSLIRQKVLSLKKYDEAGLQKVFDLPYPKTLDYKDFKYTSKGLTVYLTSNKLNIKSVFLPIKSVGPYLNPTYVPSNYASNLTANGDKEVANRKIMALTFDDGPNPTYTPQILKILKDNNVKATFFMLGENAKAYPNVVKQVFEAGHDIGNHSYTHPALTRLSAAQVKSEVEKTDLAVFNAIGQLPKYFRPPYGAVNVSVANTIDRPVIQWDVDSQDWESKNSNSVIARINSTIYGGNIILMHDIQPATVAALPTVIKNLKAKGYELVTISKMFNQRLLPGYQYFGSGDERVIK